MTPTPFATAGIRLRQLLANELCGECTDDIRATSCTSDWRQIEPGDVFVAITCDDDDGHDYAIEAVEKGAAAVICERPLPVFGIPQLLVADSRVAYGRLCQALVGNPTRHMKVIGVAGSHGKTSVARLLSAVLREAGHTVGTLDSFGYWDGENDRAQQGPLSAPAVARALAEMAAVGATHAVVEMSSIDLARKTFAGITLDAACITNIGQKNLEWHGSVENYRKTQRSVLEYLADSGVAILNADDAESTALLDEVIRPVLTYGLQGASEISASIIEQHINEQIFLLTTGDDTVAVRTELVGDHHIYNCLAAATTALVYGVEPTVVARGLEGVRSLPGRMERIMGGQEFAVLVDAADSPEALRISLRAARQSTTGRLICVFGAAGGGDESQRLAIGRVIGSFADAAAITHGRLSEFGSHRSILEVRSGFVDTANVHVILDRREAIHWALAEARSGDTVLIAGMGAEPHTPLGSEGELVNDREIVRDALRGLPVGSPLKLVA